LRTWRHHPRDKRRNQDADQV